MFVVTLPASAHNNPEAFALKANAAGADMLEIRGDLTLDVQQFNTPLPLLVSPRGTGSVLLQKFQPTYLDLEEHEHMDLPNGVTMMRSFHDHTRTPSLNDLKKIARRLMAEKPDILKIATTIRSYEDLSMLEKLRASIPKDQKSIILGMGERAHLQRMLSPVRDALTYTYVDEGEAAAPGQISLSMYKLILHCRTPKMFGLLCGLGTRSLSPLIHNTLFGYHAIDAFYCLFPTDDLADAWGNLTAMGIEGFSVTAPWKEKIIPYLDRLDATTDVLQSVNTVLRKEKEWIGHNTDVVGFIDGYPFVPDCRDVVILGSGGVVPAIIHACQQMGIKDIRIFARSDASRQRLHERFAVHCHTLQDAVKVETDCCICCITEDIPLPLPIPRGTAHAIDLRYNRSTLFLEKAAACGFNTHDGRAMLVHQALAQFQLFTEIAPSKFLTSLYGF